MLIAKYATFLYSIYMDNELRRGEGYYDTTS